MPHLETLAHLEVVLVGEVPREALHLDAVVRTLRDELERDVSQPVLDQRGNLPRVRTRNLLKRVRLPDDEAVFDFADEVLCLAEDGAPVRVRK